MPITVTMPRLSDTMERGTVVAWNVKEGDKIKPGQSLGDIETDKATMELQSFDTGVVAAILVPTGQSVEVSRPILLIAEPGEDVASVKAGAGAIAVGGGAAKKAAAAGAPSSSGGVAVAEPVAGGANGVHAGTATGGGWSSGGRIFVSPLARKIAEESGVDLAAIQGTGPAGRIIRRDVEAAASGGTGFGGTGLRPVMSEASITPSVSTGQRPVPPMAPSLPAFGAALESKRITLNNMRRTIATRLVQSKTTVPHYQVTTAVSMDALMGLRGQLNDQLASQGVKLSVNDFIVRACALAMHQHPFVNASWGNDGESIQMHGRVNVGVAVALSGSETGGGGLVVATLRDADRMGLRLISQQTKALADKARAKGLTIEEMSDATFTISNLGMFGVEHFTAIINPPNAAILAVGAAVKKPVVRTVNGTDQVVVGHEMQMTMSSDHRVVDGAMAAAFLHTVKQYLEAPATLLV
ncbi:MAG: dihydrolipoamide acetyltransferase family protein [Phycisphaerales bacterium]